MKLTHVTAVFLSLLGACATQEDATQGLETGPGSEESPTGPLESDPASGALAHDCDTDAGYELDAFAGAGGALGIVGIYEPRNDDPPWWAEPACAERLDECSADPSNCEIDDVCDRESPPRPGSVRIERGGPSILVLASYDPTNWTVTVAEDATLERVILSGYYPNTAEVPAGVVVQTANLGVAYEWITDGETSDFECWADADQETCDFLAQHYQSELEASRAAQQALVRGAEELTGATLQSFHGCYAMSTITLGAAVE